MSSEQRQSMDEDSSILKNQDSDRDFGAHPLAEELVQWFTQHGGQLSPDVHVAYSNSRGFHMRATRSLKSVVVTCPLKLTLSRLNLDPEQKEVLCIDSPLRHCIGKIPDHILTYLLLIEQRKKGRESPWHAYIVCLPEPESMTTPLWFNGEDMGFLAGTSLAPAAKERKSEYHQQWEHAMNIMKEAGIALADEIQFELLLWAATIFTSRAFISTHILPDQETVPILFPVVDILNHSVSAKVEWDFQPHRSFSLRLLDGATYTAGQELFNNYAPKQNDELLLGYGFCLEDNPIEQFPLKLAYSSMLQNHAQEIGLLKSDSVPFGMSPEFLNNDNVSEQHFLRAKGHPFGRYQNHIPFFRGIPPYIVHFFFIQTVLSLDLDIHGISVERPGPRITLQVLTLLYQAIVQRSQTLPLSIPQRPQNDKQKYAKIYRDGQAKIIYSVRLELDTAITRLRASQGQVPTDRPVLITQTEAIAALGNEQPAETKKFKEGIEKHELNDLADEALIWTLLFVCLAAYSLAHEDYKDSLINSWLRDLYTRHALPPLEDGIEDADTYTFVDSNLSDFLQLPHFENDSAPVDRLDDLGLTLISQPADSVLPVFVNGKSENLGVRIIMWAMKVAELELVPVYEDGVVKRCLYAKPWEADENGKGEEWMYEEHDDISTAPVT